jgi:predicted ABC-type transport system involved in lysophospholipase L1 biosynthesis ATPase subunit
MRVSPPKCRVEIIHTENDIIPKHVAQNYYDLHKSNHENIRFTLIDNADHYTLIDPRGSGFEKLIKVLANMQKVSSGEIK